MSTIPPNWLASILGAPESQRSAGAAKNKDAADQAERSGTARFTENLHEAIENADRDGQVYADAQGLGSQGRETPESEEEAAHEPDADESAPGQSIDVQA